MIGNPNGSLSEALGWGLLVLAPLLAWMIGGIPWGVLLVRWVRGLDLRKIGSGNIGATNAARAMGGGKTGLALFLVVYLLDLAKAPAAMLPLLWLPPPPPGMEWLPGVLMVQAGGAVILGHCFSLWLGFRGGKGVATTCGVLLVLDWRILLLALGIFFLVLVTTRMVSLGSILLGLSLPILWFFLCESPLEGEGFAGLVFQSALAFLILLRHRSNLARIFSGEESKISLGRRGKNKKEGKG